MAARAGHRMSWEDVRARVDAACRRAGRAPDSVGLVAVSKGVAAERVRAVVAAGARDLERAATAYNDMTKACIDCHRYVARMRLTGGR